MVYIGWRYWIACNDTQLVFKKGDGAATAIVGNGKHLPGCMDSADADIAKASCVTSYGVSPSMFGFGNHMGAGR